MKLPGQFNQVFRKISEPVKAILPSRGSGDTHSLITTPWAWRNTDGVYSGHNGDVWLYRVLDCAPSYWEDPSTQLGIGSQLSSALYDLAATSKDLGVGIRSFSKLREIHLLSVTWEEDAKVPAGTPEALASFLYDTLDFTVPRRAVVLGVRLWQRSSSDEEMSIMDRARKMSTSTLSEKSHDLANYSDDMHVVTNILDRYGISEVPNREIRRRMEAWYNDGKHADATLYEARDAIYLHDNTGIELSALMSFGENPVFHAPETMWGFVAGTGRDAADVISVRCALEPASLARNQIRRKQRQMIGQIEEERATEDLERVEFQQNLDFGQQVENFIVAGNEPLLSDCSIVMARYLRPGSTENYKDALAGQFGFEMKPLEMRQMPALRETLPCGIERVNPFLQSISVSMLAYAGLQSFSNLGDSKGAFLGLVDPDYAPCFLDPLAAPAANKPPAMLIAGEPGSGKTFTAQAIALQSALAGHKTVFINPKSDDTLEGLTDIVDGEVIRLSEVSEQGGFFDPFRFCPSDEHGRSVAADILTQHILAVLGSRGVAGQGFTQTEEIAMTAGIRAGAAAGATCAAEAIAHIADESVRELIMQQASDPLFALGIGRVPAASYASSGELLLIEFDKPLDIPESGISPSEYTRSQRLAVAAVRLVTRASLELLGNNDGGVMIVDEAWMFLQSSAGLAALQSIGRLGRSKNILPIFATQRVDDVIKEGVDMQSYLSRVLCMKLTDPREAKAALTLCKLEPTESRIEWLREAGSKYDSNGNLIRGAMGLHKDLDDRHAAVMIGPFPEYARQSFSTNPEDRKARKAALEIEKRQAIEAETARLAALTASKEEEARQEQELAAVETPQTPAPEAVPADLTAAIDPRWVREPASPTVEPAEVVAEVAESSPAETPRNLIEDVDSRWVRNTTTPDAPEKAPTSSAQPAWNEPAEEDSPTNSGWNSPEES